MNRNNLFTGVLSFGSSSDGASVGTSQEFAGKNQHALIMLKNVDGAQVHLEYREAPERVNAFSPWTQLGKATTCNEHITEYLHEGFVYRCRVSTASGQVELFINDVSDEVYEHHDNSEEWQSYSSKFGFNCGGTDESGLI